MTSLARHQWIALIGCKLPIVSSTTVCWLAHAVHTLFYVLQLITISVKSHDRGTHVDQWAALGAKYTASITRTLSPTPIYAH